MRLNFRAGMIGHVSDLHAHQGQNSSCASYLVFWLSSSHERVERTEDSGPNKGDLSPERIRSVDRYNHCTPLNRVQIRGTDAP